MIKTLKDLVEYVSICPCCRKNINLDYDNIVSRKCLYFKDNVFGIVDS
jgi:hypothetical protein